jgi:predicted GIY-YIG superfamily endonuclease
MWKKVGKTIILCGKLSVTKPRPLFMFYVYILETKKGLYIGYTKDLKRRVKEHQGKFSAKLIYYESYILEEKARTREQKLKYYGSAWHALKKRIT